jgi:acetyltransferase-like isoleucine patch superfamily enzyme
MFMKSEQNFRIGDFFHKVISKLKDLILKFYWKLVIGSIGRGSIIKPGVKVIGNPKRISIGKNFKIWHCCFISVGNGTIIFGNDGHIGVGVYINASRGNIVIGNHVAIAPKTQIYSYSDHYEQGKLIGEVHRIGNVTIKNNVLIGSGCIILPGVTIQEGAIIGSGSVVNKDIPSNSIAGGVPAKIIKMRD